MGVSIVSNQSWIGKGCGLLALSLTHTLLAQTLPPGIVVPQTGVNNRPLDQGIEDLDSLSTSLRVMPIDLRDDDRFEYLRRDPRLPGQYVRRAGGLVATFPISRYLPTQNGTLVEIPAGTVFHIGDPAPTPAPTPTSQESQRSVPAPENKISLESLKAETLERDEGVVATLIAATPMPRIEAARIQKLHEMSEASANEPVELPQDMGTMSHEMYRKKRLREIARVHG